MLRSIWQYTHLAALKGLLCSCSLGGNWDSGGSGTTLSAQTRYCAGVREILECFFDKKPIRDEYLIVEAGKLAGVGAHSYSEGNATGGSEEAAKFKHGK